MTDRYLQIEFNKLKGTKPMQADQPILTTTSKKILVFIF